MASTQPLEELHTAALVSATWALLHNEYFWAVMRAPHTSCIAAPCLRTLLVRRVPTQITPECTLGGGVRCVLELHPDIRATVPITQPARNQFLRCHH